jgi:hypothetical protein
MQKTYEGKNKRTSGIRIGGSHNFSALNRVRVSERQDVFRLLKFTAFYRICEETGKQYCISVPSQTLRLHWFKKTDKIYFSSEGNKL